MNQHDDSSKCLVFMVSLLLHLILFLFFFFYRLFRWVGAGNWKLGCLNIKILIKLNVHLGAFLRMAKMSLRNKNFKFKWTLLQPHYCKRDGNGNDKKVNRRHNDEEVIVGIYVFRYGFWGFSHDFSCKTVTIFLFFFFHFFSIQFYHVSLFVIVKLSVVKKKGFLFQNPRLLSNFFPFCLRSLIPIICKTSTQVSMFQKKNSFLSLTSVKMIQKANKINKKSQEIWIALL